MTNDKKQIAKNYFKAVNKRNKWQDKHGSIGCPDFGIEAVLTDMARNCMTQTDCYELLNPKELKP